MSFYSDFDFTKFILSVFTNFSLKGRNYIGALDKGGIPLSNAGVKSTSFGIYPFTTNAINPLLRSFSVIGAGSAKGFFLNSLLKISGFSVKGCFNGG